MPSSNYDLAGSQYLPSSLTVLLCVFGPLLAFNLPGLAKAETLDRIINVASLGLKCDGKSDNSAVFEKLRTNVKHTQTVFFPSSDMPCLTSVPLVVVSGTTYRAAPGGVIFKPTPGSTANPVLFSASGVSDVLVEGLRFDGGLGAGGTASNIVTVYKSSNVVFDGVTVQNTLGVGIAFSTEVHASGVRNSYIINVGNQWKATGLSADQHQGIVFCCGTDNVKNFVTESHFDDVGLDAVSFSNQTGFLVSGNHFTKVGGGQNGILGAALNTKVTNHGLAGGAAIYGSNSTDVLVTKNFTDGAGGNGIDLHRVNNAGIIDNTVWRSGGNGIGFAEASNAEIKDNIVVDNNQARLSIVSAPQAGIFLTGGRRGRPPLRNVKISGNISSDDQAIKTQNYGIQLQNESTDADVYVDSTNKFSGNALSDFGEAMANYHVEPH